MLGYVPPNTVSEGEQFIHIYLDIVQDKSQWVIDPFAIVDSKEYQIVFDTLETSEDLAFSIRNQELILKQQSIVIVALLLPMII